MAKLHDTGTSPSPRTPEPRRFAPDPIPVHDRDVPARQRARVRTHRHQGATPLLPPLSLRPLPQAYDLTHVAVLPRNPRALVVMWAIDPRRMPAGGATLRLENPHGVIASASIEVPLGRFFFGDLEPDQELHARIVGPEGELAVSRAVLLPPDGPSRLHQPAMGTIHADRPLAILPSDLRASVQPAPRPAGSTAAERVWRAGTTGSDASPNVEETETPAHVEHGLHKRLVSSFVHTLER